MQKQTLALVSDTGVPSIGEAEANQLVKVQRDILKLIVTGHDFQKAFDALCLVTEKIVDNALASIMFYKSDYKALEVRSAPNLPLEALSLFNGLVPDENAASCGTTVFKGTPQFASDTSTDSRWKDHQNLVENLNVHACWSMPICDESGRSIGSFALSSFEKRSPTDFQINLLQSSAYLAGLILQRENDHKALQKAAHYDHLTHLPNRFLFNLEVDRAISRASRTGNSFSLFYIDLDDFKQVNDELGHEAGDEILLKVAQRMNENIRSEDLLTRIGGDEFILLVESVSTHNELLAIAEKIQTTLMSPFWVKDKDWNIRASIGISSYPENGLNIDQLVRCADKAMYRAKSKDGSRLQFYSEI